MGLRDCDYLRPLVSLVSLDLYGNQMKGIQPALFFVNMTDFQKLNVALNRMKSLCEVDLLGFQGKHFQLLDLSSIQLNSMTQCGKTVFQCNPRDQNSPSYSGTQHHGEIILFQRRQRPRQENIEGFKNSGVKILDLSKCFIFTLQYAVFSPLREVQDITIAQNKMNKIEFLGLLQWLNLSHNLIGEIYSYTFENLPSILELDLSYNHIGALGYQAFTGLPHLQVLDLTENFFRDLGTNGYLAPLPNIQLLRLTDNKITSLEGLAGFADSTIILNIQNNRLTHLEDLLWYGNNFKKWCTFNNNISVPAVNYLKLLELRNIALQVIWARGECLHVFENLGNLFSLDLSLNSLQALPDGIFKGLISLEEMRSPLQLPHIPPTRHFPRDSQNTSPLLQFLASPDPAAFHSLRLTCLFWISWISWMNSAVIFPQISMGLHMGEQEDCVYRV
uniref:Toll-like receptor 5 n=1 Tax=Oncorhynchus kisutch TaxID=8019 RepID=A0A8C7D2B8_ONCKI